jgi:hypothetical protein
VRRPVGYRWWYRYGVWRAGSGWRAVGEVTCMRVEPPIYRFFFGVTTPKAGLRSAR